MKVFSVLHCSRQSSISALENECGIMANLSRADSLRQLSGVDDPSNTPAGEASTTT